MTAIPDVDRRFFRSRAEFPGGAVRQRRDSRDDSAVRAGTDYAFDAGMKRLSRWWTTWGSTEDERQRTMLGDTQVTLPSYQATLGVTIGATPEAVWPWLVQMGYRRGGLYSYDWLDRLFGYLDAPSTRLVLPEWQHLAPGEEIPLGRYGGFPVRAIEPCRSLVLAGYAADVEWSWELSLRSLDARHTRLISRNRVWTRPSIRSAVVMFFMQPAAFLMTRKMLVGIKERAESTPRAGVKTAA
jgi:hypothetical protein